MTLEQKPRVLCPAPVSQGGDHREVLRTQAPGPAVLVPGPPLPRLTCWCSLSRDNTLGYPAQTCRCLLLPSLPSDAESVHSAGIWG